MRRTYTTPASRDKCGIDLDDSDRHDPGPLSRGPKRPVAAVRGRRLHGQRPYEDQGLRAAQLRRHPPCHHLMSCSRRSKERCSTTCAIRGEPHSRSSASWLSSMARATTVGLSMLPLLPPCPDEAAQSSGLAKHSHSYGRFRRQRAGLHAGPRAPGPSRGILLARQTDLAVKAARERAAR